MDTAIITITPKSLSASDRDSVALICGSSRSWLDEYRYACDLLTGKEVSVFAVNDTIGVYPGVLDHAVTLHPDKLAMWLHDRLRHGLRGPDRVWAHRAYPGATDDTRDWQGSSGLLAVKVARELGFTKVLLAGVPMTVEDGHFLRQKDWHAAHGFRRGWYAHTAILKPYVRSVSGWTQEQFGGPTLEWLDAVIPDEHRVYTDRQALKA